MSEAICPRVPRTPEEDAELAIIDAGPARPLSIREHLREIRGDVLMAYAILDDDPNAHARIRRAYRAKLIPAVARLDRIVTVLRTRCAPGEQFSGGRVLKHDTRSVALGAQIIMNASWFCAQLPKWGTLTDLEESSEHGRRAVWQGRNHIADILVWIAACERFITEINAPPPGGATPPPGAVRRPRRTAVPAPPELLP